MAFSGDLVVEHPFISNFAQCTHNFGKIDGPFAEWYKMLVGTAVVIGNVDRTKLFSGCKNKIMLRCRLYHIEMSGVEGNAKLRRVNALNNREQLLNMVSTAAK